MIEVDVRAAQLSIEGWYHCIFLWVLACEDTMDYLGSTMDYLGSLGYHLGIWAPSRILLEIWAPKNKTRYILRANANN